VAWIVRLVNTGADGEKQSADVMKINRPDDFSDIANLGLTLAEGKLLLAGLQQEIVAAQAKGHAVRPVFAVLRQTVRIWPLSQWFTMDRFGACA
jgi:hypothetical protein